MPRAGGADVPGPSDVPRLLLDAAPPAGARTLSRLRHARAHGMGTTEYLRHALRRAVLRARLRRRLELAPGAYVGAGVVLDVAPGARLSLGRGCWLGDGSLVRIRGGEVTIGDRSLLGEGCAISAHRRVTIGAGCLIGDRVMIVDFDHETADVERPVRLQGLRAAAVELGDGARIGPNAAVLRGVTVGAGAAVDARSVVTRDVPAGATVTGVPARRRVAQTGTRSRSA